MYDIGAKEGLLDIKHIEKMGTAVWLFLYLVARSTDANGNVLGYTPLQYERVKKELGITRDRNVSWIETLRTEGYIKTQKTMRGLMIKVNNPKKRCGEKPTTVVGKTPQHVREKPTTKRQDSLQDSKTYSGSDEPRLEISLFSKGKTMEEITYEYYGKKKQPTGMRKDLFP